MTKHHFCRRNPQMLPSFAYCRHIYIMMARRLDNVRVELFFRDAAQLRQRVQWLHDHGVRRVNVVNKSKQDDMATWVGIRDVMSNTSVNICAHYSCKFQRVPRAFDVAQHASQLHTWLQILPAAANEVLIVSGSRPTKSWDSVLALQHLKATQSVAGTRIFAVVYNPFLTDPQSRRIELQRLQQKLGTNIVSKVYLQFGTNLELARQAIDDISGLPNGVALAASIFLPTKKLITQQSFRPWKGVFLSDEFQSGPESARQVVVELMQLYINNDVEILFEAPGVTSDADWELVQELLTEAGGGSRSDRGTKRQSNGATRSKRRKESASADPSRVRPKKQHKTDTNRGKQAKPRACTDRCADPAVVLFGSHDVRLHDNWALQAALEHDSILPVVLYDTSTKQAWRVGAAAEVVWKKALWNLECELRRFGFILLCKNTVDPVEETAAIAKSSGASTVYLNRHYTPESRAFIELLEQRLAQDDIRLFNLNSSLLYDVEVVDLPAGFRGGHWGTLMPFLKACQKDCGEPPRSLDYDELERCLERTTQPEVDIKCDAVKDLQMAEMPCNTQWDAPILQRFPMSHKHATRRLDMFYSESLSKYENERHRADKDLATSQLSVYLRIGVLSPHEVYWRTQNSALATNQTKTFYRRLFWRELAYFQLHCFPDMREKSIRHHYDNVQWVEKAEGNRRFQAWKRGLTGYPIVDAGMRELYETGWMHQSIRMVCASFLIEHMRIDWRRGADWFYFTLADADEAINYMMWQNAGKSGVDPWNFVLSPSTGSQDPSGGYVAHWVPELRHLPKKDRHQPWKASNQQLEEAGVKLGENYPNRIIKDLRAESAQRRQDVLTMRRASQSNNSERGYDVVKLPNGDETIFFTPKEFRIDKRGQALFNK